MPNQHLFCWLGCGGHCHAQGCSGPAPYTPMYFGFSLSTNVFELIPEAGLARGCALSRVSCPSPFSPPDWSQDMVLSKQVA